MPLLGICSRSQRPPITETLVYQCLLELCSQQLSLGTSLELGKENVEHTHERMKVYHFQENGCNWISIH